ncbi:hypothetical protein TNCT_49391 [Trichonephila clavata]|uniref:Uncharacterized protein n=1 Tax=Trichonephila clavata TaxID=2740835 RepID=A0A8X6HAM2_TRICU|nr:hypothetical protein TNCT_49391 [Trichonephila clavata]
MLDTSAYNAYVLFTSIHSNWNENNLTKRRLFLEELRKNHSFLHTMKQAKPTKKMLHFNRGSKTDGSEQSHPNESRRGDTDSENQGMNVPGLQSKMDNMRINLGQNVFGPLSGKKYSY